MTASGRIIVPGPDDVAAVRAASPLSADLFLQCGPARVPVAGAGIADAETRQDSAGHALRRALADDPWAGMGSLAKVGWLLVAAEAAHLVFAQRIGPVGTGQVLVLTPEGAGWQPSSLTGARLVTDDPHERVERVVAASVDGGSGGPGCSLRLAWVGEGEVDGLAVRRRRRIRRVRALEDYAGVHVLLVSGPAGEAARPSGTDHGTSGFGAQPSHQWVAGVGTVEREEVLLAAPIGGRALWDDSGIPAHRVEVETG